MRKERPILFSTPMIQAILEGRKTQTRRVVKLDPPKPTAKLCKCPPHIMDLFCWFEMHYSEVKKNGWIPIGDSFKSPYGNVGDILWVRETWAVWPNPISADYGEGQYVYKADGEYNPPKWKPSIFMPREACRIKLEITNVRVERLQDISEADAKAEGIQFHFEELFQEYRYKDYDKKLAKGYGHPDHDYPTWREAKSSFKSLWESINGEVSWNSNPYVWVVDFKRIEP